MLARHLCLQFARPFILILSVFAIEIGVWGGWGEGAFVLKSLAIKGGMGEVLFQPLYRGLS